MILAPTSTIAMLLMVLGILCWGSWATTFKYSGKRRFELYYYDFAIGLAVAAMAIAFTFGNLGFDGFAVVDDLLHAGKRQWFYGILAGLVFNFGNMLLVGAVSVAGMAVSFAVGLGTALIAGTVLQYLVHPSGDPNLLMMGFAVGLVGMVFAGIAYRGATRQRHERLARRGEAKSTRRPSVAKGIVVSVAGGLLMGASIPILDRSAEGELGLGPYSIVMLASFGVVASTFVFNLFLTNLPLEGEPVDMLDFFDATVKQHLLGFGGGAVWAVGAVAVLVAMASLPERVRATSPESFPLAQASLVVAGIWGLAKWKEFAGARVGTKLMMVMSLALMGCAVALVVMGISNQRLF